MLLNRLINNILLFNFSKKISYKIMLLKTRIRNLKTECQKIKCSPNPCQNICTIFETSGKLLHMYI